LSHLLIAAAAVPSSFASLIPSLDQDSNDVGRLQGSSSSHYYWKLTNSTLVSDLCYLQWLFYS